MSGYEASCPSCGASLVFTLGSSLLRVCEHCGVAVARKGANLEAYGRVAELIVIFEDGKVTEVKF